MAGRNQAGKNQTKDLKCATHLLSDKFRNMSKEKKEIVRDLGFGGLMHILPLRVHHQILKELANSFKLGENILKTGYGSFKVRPKIIGAALGINASGDLFPQKINYKDLSEDDKQIFRRFQGKILKNLTDEMMAIGVDNEQDRLMFKRIFILYIQMAFLLPTTINKISPVHLAPIFKMDTITEWNWGAHVLNFIIKGITDYNLQKKKAIDGCLFALMIVYFHLSKNKDKKRAKRPPEPWIANWTKEQLVERMRGEMEEHMVHSTSESETEEDSEDSTRKQPTRKAKKTQSKKKKVIVEDSSSEQDQSYHGYSTLSEIGTEELDEFLRENNEKYTAQGEKEADLRSTEGHYVSSETIPDINLGSDDPSSQGHTDQSSVNKPAESMLSLVVKSASEPAEENMMVVRKETQSEALAIVPIQVCLPLSQTTTMPEIEQTPVTENEPTLCYKLKELQKGNKYTPEPPQKPEESTPTLPQLHLKYNNPAPEDAAALMMMARTASYVPKIDLMPSFSLGLTDSSQEEAATQKGASTQDGERAKTPETPKLLEQLGDLFETPARTNEDTSDMKEKCYLWAIRVKTYADGLTNEFDTVYTLQAQDKYILSKLHLASLATETHIEAEIVSAKCFILNQQKIKRFQEEVYCLPPDIVNMAIANHPQGTRDKDKEIVPPYLHISGQKTSYDCAIYVMKWLEIFQAANIKRLNYEWHNWTQDEMDHFRVEYVSRILFHEMNQDKAEAIRGSNAIRLSKPSSLLLSPYCQIDSKDIDTD
ncbi:uncharacterized protein DS421_19g649480 [Arachis hypogaea]|uniref:Ubiquitin-like protease family profile domain-containing protein n=1 Tax=Arachis hypogaea TaxID=3818 RepID=A0A6B9V7S3_ARAHY|nr:uncharacterized protein DS421_19g649480 [Arachis hypogaea]